jgi:hypothetical protein
LHTNIKIPNAQLTGCKALGQIFNVLIILVITLLMAVVTVVLAYFADIIPSVVDNGTLIATNASVSSAQDN